VFASSSAARFRSRVTGLSVNHHPSVTYALCSPFFPRYGFGGNNGLTDFKTLIGFDLHRPTTRLGSTSPPHSARDCLPRVPVHHQFKARPPALGAARHGKPVRFLGYSVTNAKLFVFTVSAVLAGVSGALYVRRSASSIRAILAATRSRSRSGVGRRPRHAGGRDTRRGSGQPDEDLADQRGPGNLAVILGGLFILTTLVFPRGIVGSSGSCAGAGGERKRRPRRRSRRRSKHERAASDRRRSALCQRRDGQL